nr:hypothetical protein [Tanacetum cinerariifolium]
MHMLSPKPDSFYHTEQNMALGYQNPFYLKQAQQKQQSLYNDNILLEKYDPPVVYDSKETLELAQEKAAKFVRDFKSLAKEVDESLAKHKALELKIERLLRAVVDQDILSIVQRVNNTAKAKRPQPRSNTKNDIVPSLAIKNDKSKVVCAMCKQCLITANHDVYVLNYVNDMNSHGKKQKANVSNTENQKKQKSKVMKHKKVGTNERLASPKTSKPRSYLRWLPTERLFDLKGKIIASSESESQSDCSNGDNACTSNPTEPTIKQFLNSTSFLGRVYNQRSKKIIETINVAFDELSAMAFEQSSSKPELQGMTSGKITAPRTTPAAQVPPVRQTLKTSTTITDTAPTPTNSSSQATNFPNTSQDVNELETQQQHVQQQNNQAPLHPK